MVLKLKNSTQLNKLVVSQKHKFLCQFCAISLQKQAILLGIPKYISPFIILIILTLFVAVFPCLPM